MGFAVNYTSIGALTDKQKQAIRATVSSLIEGHTWLSCEPPFFFQDDEKGLWGAAKPNFMPHPCDIASARTEELPDGTVRDLLDILCAASREHGVDWIIGHDHDGEVGRICDGVCDAKVLDTIEAFAELSQMFLDEALGEMGIDVDDPTEEFDDDSPPKRPSHPDQDGDDDDDEPPATIKMWKD